MFAVSDLSCNSGLYLLLDTLNDRLIDSKNLHNKSKPQHSYSRHLREIQYNSGHEIGINQPIQIEIEQFSNDCRK